MLAQAPIASLVERINRLTSPFSSTCAPAFATPTSNDAPGIALRSVNCATHVCPIPAPTPKSEAHALYPKLAGDAQGRICADAPIEI